MVVGQRASPPETIQLLLHDESDFYIIPFAFQLPANPLAPLIRIPILVHRIRRSATLAQHTPNIHLLLPDEEDYNQYAATYETSRLFPLRRAIAEFEDRVIDGEEGEWALPSPEGQQRYRRMTMNVCR